MATAARTTVPPASLRPRTHVTRRDTRGKVVRVRTSRPWNREEFFKWLDAEIARTPGIKHVGDLADQAGMSHTTLSNWRRGVQRPTTQSLALLAPVLKVTARELWVRAGLLEAGDVGMDGDAGNSATHAPLDWYEQMIEDSKLPRTAKDALIAARRQELAQERERLAALIKVMENPGSE